MNAREFFDAVDEMPYETTVRVVLNNDVMGDYYEISEISYYQPDNIVIVHVGEKVDP